MRRGINVTTSNAALVIAYSISNFADVLPPAGETSSDDNFFLGHERTNDGDVVRVHRRAKGRVVLSWAISTAYWIKLARKSMELGI